MSCLGVLAGYEVRLCLLPGYCLGNAPQYSRRFLPSRNVPAVRYKMRQPSRGRGQRDGNHQSRQNLQSGRSERRHLIRAQRRRQGRRSRS